MTRGGANYRVKWQSCFSILRAPGALNTENTVLKVLMCRVLIGLSAVCGMRNQNAWEWLYFNFVHWGKKNKSRFTMMNDG